MDDLGPRQDVGFDSTNEKRDLAPHSRETAGMYSLQPPFVPHVLPRLRETMRPPQVCSSLGKILLLETEPSALKARNRPLEENRHEWSDPQAAAFIVEAVVTYLSRKLRGIVRPILDQGITNKTTRDRRDHASGSNCN
jgi:hypothetical protein